jgi:DNA-binding GntR family transcriptional regulator
MVYVPRSAERPGERVTADLRQRLASDEWASGDPLPPVSALAEEYGVARATVARALGILADEGLVNVIPRWGTFRV